MEEASVEEEHASGAREFRSKRISSPSLNRRNSQGCWVVAEGPCPMVKAVEPSRLLGHECTCSGLRRGGKSKWPLWVNDASGVGCGMCSIMAALWHVFWPKFKVYRQNFQKWIVDANGRLENVLEETDWTHCSEIFRLDWGCARTCRAPRWWLAYRVHGLSMAAHTLELPWRSTLSCRWWCRPRRCNSRGRAGPGG